MTAPILTILIPTLGQRRELLARLLDGLMPQVEKADGAVQVLGYWDSGELAARMGSVLAAIAHKRQALVDAVTTDYLCCIDDDDTVSDDYVTAILAALESRPDYVGMWQMNYMDGVEYRRAELSLRHTGWHDGPEHLCRDITQANPIRTALARTADYRRRADGECEDVAWAAQLRPAAREWTEVMIDRVLHHHRWVAAESSWSAPGRVRLRDGQGRPWQRLEVDSPRFAWLEA